MMAEQPSRRGQSCTLHPRRFAGQQRGMTLIEVLISVLLFSFGLLGILGLQSKAHGTSMAAEDNNRAALIASELVSSVITSQTASGTIVTPSASYWSGRASTVLPNGTLTFSLDATSKVGTIVVTWKAPQVGTTKTANTYTTQVILP